MRRKISKNPKSNRITNRDLRNILDEEVKKRDQKLFLSEKLPEMLEENFFKKAAQFLSDLFGGASKKIQSGYKKSVQNLDKSQTEMKDSMLEIIMKINEPKHAQGIGKALETIEAKSAEAFKAITQEAVREISDSGIEASDATAIVSTMMMIAQPAINPDGSIKLVAWNSIKEAVGKMANSKEASKEEDGDSDGDGDVSLSTSDEDSN